MNSISARSSTLFTKSSALVAATALALGILVAPSTTLAAGQYSIDGTATPNGLFVSVTGEAAAAEYTGQGDDQHVSIDWNEDNGSTPSNANSAWETVLNINASGGSFASTTWSGSHTYPGASPSQKIFVRVHHAQAGGAESGSGQIQFTVEILPQCDDSVDNDDDGFVDYPDDPGCTSATDDSESPDPTTTGTLHIVKVLPNDNGGTATPDNFSFQVDGGSVTAFDADGQNDLVLPAGTYDVTEVAAPGYTTTYNGCSDISLTAGGQATCTITNDDIAPTITVNKTVVSGHGGSATASSFQYFIDVTTELFDGVAAAVMAGVHTLTETFLAGYSGGPWGGDCAADGSITLTLGQNAHCTITNTQDAPTSGTVTVTKIVDNTWGGATSAGDFTLTLTASTTATTSITSGAPTSLLDGIYVFSETGPAGYVASFSGDCDENGNVTVTAGTNTSCTVTNTAQPANLTVTKVVDNGDKTGSSQVSDFTLTVGGSSTTTVTSGAQNDFVAGTYTISESGPSGYSATFSGDCAADGTITMVNGQNYACTITNDDIPPTDGTLTIVANAAGGDGTFGFTVSGPTATMTSIATSGGSGTTSPMTVSAGSYAITASFPSNWTVTGSSCTNGESTLDPADFSISGGDDIACTFSGEKQAEPPPPAPEEGRSGGGGGRAACPDGAVYNSATRECEPRGQVLGAATTTPQLGVTCGLYMDQYLRMGSPKNNPDQVTKLQQFLLKYDFGRFTATGYFGPLTFAATKAFQLANKETILQPWGISVPTGLAYLTTIRQLNLIECPDLMIPQPELVPWNLNPSVQ